MAKIISVFILTTASFILGVSFSDFFVPDMQNDDTKGILLILFSIALTIITYAQFTD